MADANSPGLPCLQCPSSSALPKDSIRSSLESKIYSFIYYISTLRVSYNKIKNRSNNVIYNNTQSQLKTTCVKCIPIQSSLSHTSGGGRGGRPSSRLSQKPGRRAPLEPGQAPQGPPFRGQVGLSLAETRQNALRAGDTQERLCGGAQSSAGLIDVINCHLFSILQEAL